MLISQKETAITSTVIIICLALFYLFPTGGGMEKMTASLFFLLIIPMLYIKLILKKNLRDFGWQVNNWRKGVVFSGMSLAFCLLIFYVIFKYADLQNNYFLPRAAYQSFWYFIFYELFIVGVFLALYLFFFSGFVFFSFEKILGSFAPLLPFFLFVVFFWIVSAFSWKNYGYIILSFPLPFVVQRSRSLFFPLVAGLLFMLISDAVVIKFT